jgi:UMF1 family MFS transporter
MELNNKKIINAWCMFDWANSVYSLVITVAIFPAFYEKMTFKAFHGNIVNFLGLEIPNTVLYGYSLSFSFLLLSFLLPILSGIADIGGNKKPFMRFFTILGSLSCIGLFWFDGANIVWGITCFFLASLGFGGSIVFYNAYLPEIASPDQYDAVSAKGFSLGYFGSVLLLLLNLLMAIKPELFGFDTTDTTAFSVRISFVLVGLWWFGFSQITFYYLPNHRKQVDKTINIFVQGFAQLKSVLQAVSKQPFTLRFLLGFFFYNAGVQTVLYLATLFASKELQMTQDKLIVTILILQIVAIAGAAVFAKVSEKQGNKFTILIILSVWIVDCICAYFVTTDTHFYLLAAGVGIVMGGIQSLSRATYCKLFPENTTDTASYFSLYDVLDKFSTFFGTFAYTYIEQITGSMRNSIFALSLFFIIGFVFIATIQIKAAKKEVVA